ncbi:MAG: hypothetical protein HN948_02185 [Clostridia bacterium]|jgi:uroporphyrinogen decarboxylase|nr:hypothetical protein [Clostridia bacterium]MBT7121799.1 hypothetical protein [Clostridia bacterium]
MTNRERALAAIAGDKTDRTSYNFRAEPSTCEKLYRHLGFRDYDKLVDHLNPDIMLIDAVFPAEKDFGAYYQNCWGEKYLYKQTQYGPVRDDIDGALADAKSIEDFKNFNWPKNDDVDYSDIKATIERHPDMAIQYGSADVWQRPGLVRGMANFMMDMKLSPQFCHFMSEYFMQFYIEEYRRAQEAADGKIDIFTLYSDLGSQNAPLISHDMFMTFVFPYIKTFAEAIHQIGGKLFFHTCGEVSPFIDSLIEAGVDILDPIQPCTEQMQPEELAKEYCGKVCFHGGVDVQQVLSVGTPQDVRASVNRYKKAFEGCAYILAPSHYIQMDTPVENILALYEECMADK